MNIAERVAAYNEAFPNRPGLLADAGMVVGTWMIGSCYKNPSRMPDGSPFYGGYPYGYLERVHSMFPDARRVLHVFSGGLDLVAASDACPGEALESMELVDIHGPEQGRFPTWQGDIYDYSLDRENWGRFDLILADPPYSADDAKKYDVPMVNRGKVIRALRRVTRTGGNLVWLDTQWPMHRKDEWKTWGTVGLLRSTQHRVRMVSMFRAVKE